MYITLGKKAAHARKLIQSVLWTRLLIGWFLSSIYCNDNNIFKHILYNYCDIRYVVLSCGEIKSLIIIIIIIAWTSKRWPWHVLRKTTFANIHVKNMTRVTELELNTRAFTPPFVHIPFIPVGRTKECQECAHILLQVGSSTIRFKNVPLTNESKISLRSRSCSPAIICNWKLRISTFQNKTLMNTSTKFWQKKDSFSRYAFS